MGENVLQKGKQDRYDIYSAFIKKNELDINTHLNLDTPQGLAKLILALKLIPELEGLKKINAVTDNDKINQNIEKLSKKLATSDTTKINDALKKHLPDSKDITTDTITADQLQKLLNSF